MKFNFIYIVLNTNYILMNNEEYKTLVWAYLHVYQSRYVSFHRDSYPTYSGFVVWAEKHKKECSELELKLLEKFLGWLKLRVSNPDTRLYGMSDGTLREFIETLPPLVESGPRTSGL